MTKRTWRLILLIAVLATVPPLQACVVVVPRHMVPPRPGPFLFRADTVAVIAASTRR